MNRSASFPTIICLVAGSLLACPQVGRADEVNEFGFDNESLGLTDLDTNGGGVIVVTNFSGTGDDGVRWILPSTLKIPDATLHLDEPGGFDTTTGAFIELGGEHNKGSGTIMAVKLERADVTTLGVPGTTFSVRLTADFRPLGVDQFTARVRGGTEPVTIVMDHTRHILIRKQGLRDETPPVLRECRLQQTPTLRLRTNPSVVSNALSWGGETIEVLLPNAPAVVEGTEIVFNAGEQPLTTMGDITGITLKGFDITSATITNEVVNARAIPTLAEWGLIVMALLLVMAGAMVIGRRRISVPA